MPRLRKLLMLVAVLLMPLGMGAPPAHAQHHQATAVMTMEHCPDQDQRRDTAGGLADCALACASALPAVAPAPDDLPLAQPDRRGRPAPMAALHGLILDIATPPPRLS